MSPAATPTFAVVGHPNKGKSSVVATLTEDANVVISATPGTTYRADRYEYQVQGQALYTLIDTPGFQRAGTVLQWLQARAPETPDRGAALQAFVDEFTNTDRFVDECELLKPILAGAGIIYVVDGTKPYGPEFEQEMEILRWSGQPRMALINLIGDGDYVQAWQRGLDQYFSIVRVFDAMQASFASRMQLLSAFGELDETWRPVLAQVVATLEAERVRKRGASAARVAAMLWECLQLQLEEQLAPGQTSASPAQQATLLDRFKSELATHEQRSRDTVQAIYQHDSLHYTEADMALLDEDLFATDTWEIFGLSRTQLLASGGISGAVAGGGLDLLVGGTSLLAGTALGAVVGGLGAWFGGEEVGKVKVFGSTLGGYFVRVGPVANLNFPWVLLGRACLHWQLVSARNHAVRTHLNADAAAARNFVQDLTTAERKPLDQCFAKLRDGDAAQIAVLSELLNTLFGKLGDPQP